MPILDIQQRTRELGRIRIGQTQPTSNGKSRPAKLDRFRLTSASRPLLERVAELYGGEVRAWTPANGGPSQWEVVTNSDRLPVLVPPQAVSQWYELWSGGGCQRRCDGQREILTESPCICGPDPATRLCKPTTRLNVVLSDVEGVGVWRLESHGFYAAVELPAVAELLAQTRGYIRASLGLEERTAKRSGQTLRWMVPILEVDITPSALMAGEGGIAPAVAHAQADAVGAATAPAIAAAPAREWLAELSEAKTVEAVQDLYRNAVAAGDMTDYLSAEMAKYADLLKQATTGHVTTDAGGRPAPVLDEDPDEVWQLVILAAPDGWTRSDVEAAYAGTNGGSLPGDATSAQLRAFLTALKAGRVTKPGTDTDEAPF
ncbi:hypothetical protein ACIRPH_30080 [Nocardiopsis sp. NPDC101807]|uniref:recombination directionality factor n=1 Tax=Nocardiopsis sp. NPDC101807 TaxID=3364339 RepID=UPI0038210E93